MMATPPCQSLPLEATRRLSSCSSQQVRSPRDLHKLVCLALENNLYTFRIIIHYSLFIIHQSSSASTALPREGAPYGGESPSTATAQDFAPMLDIGGQVFLPGDFVTGFIGMNRAYLNRHLKDEGRRHVLYNSDHVIISDKERKRGDRMRESEQADNAVSHHGRMIAWS